MQRRTARWLRSAEAQHWADRANKRWLALHRCAERNPEEPPSPARGRAHSNLRQERELQGSQTGQAAANQGRGRAPVSAGSGRYTIPCLSVVSVHDMQQGCAWSGKCIAADHCKDVNHFRASTRCSWCSASRMRCISCSASSLLLLLQDPWLCSLFG